MIKHSSIRRDFYTGVRAVLLALLGLTALDLSAQTTGDLPVLDLNRPIRLNFSGSWEKDFRRSDNWEDELGRTMRIRQQVAAQQTTQGRSRSLPPISIGNLNLPLSRGRGANIVDVARLAEYISRQSTMEITQTRDEIRIERRGEAALICGIEYKVTETFANQHGVELCGWEGQQLVFQIMLPDDLVIWHRFSVSSDQQLLNLITSVSSKGAEPFNLIQAFNRYDLPANPEFECVQTLSRGRVCNQSDPDF